MADRIATQAPGDPRDWLPMRPYRGRRTFDIVDPVLEPLWSGLRALAYLTESGGERSDETEGATVVLIEDLGADVAGELPELRAAMARSFLATDAVIDGVISRQVGLDGVGAAAIPELRGRTGMLVRGSAELEVLPRGGAETEDAGPEGFIAFDLLRLDGTTLLDVPLLERKRLLESVIDQGDLVRTSIHVRPPIDTWIATWQAAGLRGGILKAANSRYRPGQDTIEWRIVERLGRRAG